MRRKYEVHIDGKPFVITDRPDPRVVPAQWLSMEVDAAEELPHLVAKLRKEPLLHGVVAYGSDVEQVWKWFRKNYRFVQAAGGAVSDEKGRLLAIHRLGVWDLPKGKVEKHESVAEGAVREVEEECGLRNVKLLAPLVETWHTYERKGEDHLKCTSWFLMEASSDQLLVAQHEEDITEVRWMDAEGVAELERNTYPSLRAVVSAWAAARHDRA